ncbi:lipoate--protein ligase family protein [bacterium]|nr:lipoate--protein ligase family protein [bacterium]
MKFIPYEVKTGAENMQIDSDLLDWAIDTQFKDAIFRLYGWSPACISLGRNQKDDFINQQLIKDNNIDVVRRLTGGRALLHDDELTYSFICPIDYLEHGENVVESYKEISQILIDKLDAIGIHTDFGAQKAVKTKFDYCMLISTGADLCYQGKKLIGSAQCRKNGYILQHGSILMDYNKDLLEKIFDEKVETTEVTCIKDIAPHLTREDLVKHFSQL